MAVTLAPESRTAAAGVRPVRVRTFVALKLRIMRNGLRGSGWRIALFVIGVLSGVQWALLGFALLAGASWGFDPAERLITIAFAGAFLVLAWVLVPLLAFGVDETLDPARFALLPVPRRTLAAGMLTAACVGIAPLATLVITLGPVVGAVRWGGPGVVAFAVLGAVLGLLLCVAASRAVTSAFASLLRSRRSRDLAMVVITVLVTLIFPIQLAVSSLFEGESRLDGAVRLANALGWTPLAAPYVAVNDAILGHWGAAIGRLAIAAAAIGALLWWWSRTLESAMVGNTSNGAASAGSTGAGKPVAALVPAALRRLPDGPFAGIVAREIRYWWRDPRRRSGLVALVLLAAVLPFAFGMSFSGADRSVNPMASLPMGLALAGLLIGSSLANQFGNDGTQHATHLLIGVPGRTDLLARLVAFALLAVPIQLVVAVGLATVSGSLDLLVPAIGWLLAAFGVSAGVSVLTSVVAPYPLPESNNPFAVSGGGATAKSMLAFVALFVAGVLLIPVYLAQAVLPAGLSWFLLPLGLAWGIGGALLGGYIGGDVLDRRGPEVLAAVTPRR